ncbi:hypothetical protein MHK_002662 [Candidatus Magnetomorum sp. HK-1]|nr:hypothetical protein MHK_002662 [Candidatus Magnetomorum sp. HK-1]
MPCQFLCQNLIKSFSKKKFLLKLLSILVSKTYDCRDVKDVRNELKKINNMEEKVSKKIKKILIASDEIIWSGTTTLLFMFSLVINEGVSGMYPN